MKTITIQDLKQGGRKVLPKKDDTSVLLISNSRPVAVILHPMQFEAMQRYIEDLEDNNFALNYDKSPDDEFQTIDEIIEELELESSFESAYVQSNTSKKSKKRS